MNEKQLTRSTNERMVAGVAGGLGEYFSMDPTLVRLIFVLLTLAGGPGLLLYLILWVIMPEAPEAQYG
jgi:phage shock protein C